LATAVYAQPRDKKSIGIFNIVKFPNDVCSSDQANRYGTCFTAEECSNLNGVASGTCAEGYGVCCVITLACGGTTRANCTHLSQTASADPNTDPGSETACTYTICPVSSTVNRIRLDISMFDIAAPASPTSFTGNAAGTAGMTSVLGSCLTDSFSVSGPSGGPYPIVCGVNNDQHMIVDTDGTGCVTALFSFGMGATMRNYEIHVTQFDRLNDMGGPARCLQYYTGLTGLARTFNWQAGQTGQHLAFHNYDICVRQEAGRCVLCWSPTTTGTATTVGTFGISNDGAADGTTPGAGAGVGCTGVASNDFIVIPNGVSLAALPASGTGINQIAIDQAALNPSRFCGRFLNSQQAAQTDTTVCTRLRQFSRLGVSFDPIEAAPAAGATPATDAVNTVESSGTQATAGTLDGPLGSAGFELGFTQGTC